MKSKWIIITAVILIIAALAVGIPVYYYTSNNYVAKVAGEKITKTEFNMLMLMLRESAESGQQFADDSARKSFWETKSSGGESLETVAKNQVLDYLKEQKICLIKAKENKIELTAEEKSSIKEQLDSTIESQFSGKRLDADKQYKAQYGVSLAQYEAFMKNDMLAQKYKSSVAEKLAPSDEDVAKEFETNKKTYDKVTVRHILFMTQDKTTGEPLPDDKKQEAKKKADDMLAQINAGGDMTALAKANSEDTGVTENGGQYIFDKYGMYDTTGQYTAFSSSSSLDQDFMNWGLEATEGKTGIVESQFGYHVMKLEKREAATLDSVKDKIKNQIASDKLYQEIDNWKKDSKYNVKTVDKVYNAIKMVG